MLSGDEYYDDEVTSGLDPHEEEIERDAVTDLLNEPEWCLFCGSETCQHVAKHNAAISGERT